LLLPNLARQIERISIFYLTFNSYYTRTTQIGFKPI
jgi:hypothetical protein